MCRLSYGTEQAITGQCIFFSGKSKTFWLKARLIHRVIGLAVALAM